MLGQPADDGRAWPRIDLARDAVKIRPNKLAMRTWGAGENVDSTPTHTILTIEQGVHKNVFGSSILDATISTIRSRHGHLGVDGMSSHAAPTGRRHHNR